MTVKQLLAAFLLSSLGALPASAGELIGRVAEWRGDPAGIIVMRNGAAVPPIQRGMAILEDDIVNIAAPDAQLHLLLANGDIRVLSSGASRIAAGEPPPGIPAKLWSWALGVLGQVVQREAVNNTQLVAATTRGNQATPLALYQGGKLLAPLIQGEKTRMLLPGDRGLHLAWKGGKPPYRVTVLAVRGGHKQVVLATPPLEAPRMDAPGLPLSVGDYEVHIDDSCGTDIDCRKIKTYIEVMPSSSIPLPPSGIDPLSTPATPGERLVQLLWLASVDDMAWSLEVYQRVATETADPNLLALRQVLVEGGKLLPP